LINETDWVVEFGPGAGVVGGEIVFSGTPVQLRGASTPSSAWLQGKGALPEREETVANDRRVIQLGRHRLPLGRLGVFVGPAGCGKSRLISELVSKGKAEELPVKRVVEFGTQSVGRSVRSNIATYCGVWNVMRPLFAATQAAQVRGLRASHFSLNTKGGRCERCKGAGVERVDLGVLPDIFLSCSSCGGRRFHRDVLAVRWKGLSAGELLGLSVSEARSLLSGHPKVGRILRVLETVGLGYMPLGQAAHTWSGGEARRIGLAKELSASRTEAAETLYLLDNPEIGLHYSDQAVLVKALWELLDAGASVWLATHNQSWIDIADCVEQV
jgi:excinuclease ABC subunit A